jgi:hypothetical protein
MKIKFIGFLIIYCLGFLILYSCDTSLLKKRSLENLLLEESIKPQRFDSIVMGVKFGMTSEEFFNYAKKKKDEGLFYPSRTGTMVTLDINKEFNYTVQFEFFPVTMRNKFMPIRKYKAILRFKDIYSNKMKMSIKNLLNQTLLFFEKGYKGNNFIKVPNDEDVFVRYNYIKIDSNRKITITPSLTMNQLNILFEDLKP